MGWNFGATARLDRDGKPSRSIDVAATRYKDGSFRACVRMPSGAGHTAHVVEVPPEHARRVRELMADTASSLRSALVAQRDGRAVVGFYDVIGHTYDIVGRVAPTSGRRIVEGAAHRYDLVGDLGSTLRSALGNVSNPLGAAQGVAQGALGGLVSGGLGGAAQGAIGAIGGAMGMSPEQAQDAAQRLAGKSAPITDPNELQARRDRALSELGAVVRAGTHPLGSANWAGAIGYHLTNVGITVPEWTALGRDQSVLAQLPRVSPFIADASLQEGPRAVEQQGPTRARADLAGAMARATSSEALAPSLRSPVSIARELSQPLPGVAIAQTNASEQSAGAALGASELLSRALATVALEQGRSSLDVANAARIARAALRAVDASAGARSGDPRARAALRQAINAASDDVASGLRLALTLMGHA